ncbi:hypothetical protein ACFZC7_21670 [Streptomyces massasporeus]
MDDTPLAYPDGEYGTEWRLTPSVQNAIEALSRTGATPSDQGPYERF